MNKKYLSLLILMPLAACSTKELYQAGQGHQQGECIKEITSGEEHRACLNQEKKPYEEYEKERQAVIKGQ